VPNAVVLAMHNYEKEIMPTSPESRKPKSARTAGALYLPGIGKPLLENNNRSLMYRRSLVSTQSVDYGT